MDVAMVKQQAQRAYSTPSGLMADILFEGTASASVPVAMETGSNPKQAPSKAPVISHRAH